MKRFVFSFIILFLFSFALFRHIQADIQPKIKKGLEALQKNQFHAAVDHFQAAVNEDPSSEEAIYYLGLSLEKSGYIKSAVATYRHLIKVNKTDEWKKTVFERLMPLEEQLAEKNYNRALSLYKKGNLPMALSFYKECVNNYPHTQKGRLAAALHEKCGLLLIARKMTKLIRKSGLKKVAVIDFTESSHVPCKKGQLLTNDFVCKLEESGQLTIINREEVKNAINAQDFSTTHLLDTGKATTIGKIVDADVVVVGIIDNNLELTVLDVRTGENISTHSLELLKREKALTLQSSVLEYLQSIEGCRNNLKIELWTDKGKNAVYRIGDEVKFFFRTSDNSYVTLFGVKTCGSISILFPNKTHPDNLLSAGKIYSVPSKKDSHTITVCPPTGIEVIKAVATISREPLFDLTISEKGSYQELQAGKEAVKAAQNLHQIIKKMPPHQWAEAHINFEIRE